MWDFLTRLFDTTGFPPRWNCGSAWGESPGIGWLHIVSDILVFGAYTAIPFVLVYFIRKRPDVPFPRVFWLFGAFIFACGAGHLIESTLFWWPAYRFSGGIKLFTAVVSWATVFALIPVLPQALALPGMARVNDKLREEIRHRETAESKLIQLNESLEDVVTQKVNELRKSEEHLRVAQRAAELGTLEYHPDRKEIACSADLLKLYGRPPEREVLPFAEWLDIVHPQDRIRAGNDLQRAVQEEDGYQSVFRIVRPDGTVRHVLAQGGRIAEGSNGEHVIVGVNIDVTHRRELEEAIGEQVTKEQQRISQELHDDLGQQLTGLGFLAKSLQRTLSQSSSPQAKQAQELADAIPGIVRSVRAIVHGLMPVEVDTIGLMAALEQLAKNASGRAGVTCEFHAPSSVHVEDEEVSTQFYRIAQEAVNNAVKHAEAKRIAIHLDEQEDQLKLTVEDDGVGLPDEMRRNGGMGLRILRHRASLIGARLSVSPRPEGGTHVGCVWTRKT